MTADDIIAAARECIGLPFRHQGRFDTGTIDCAGVVVHALQSCGCEITDRTAYGPVPNNGLLEQSLDEQPCVERVFDMTPGDILLLRFTKQPQHLGIYTGENIIHADSDAGKCCEHILNKCWSSRVVRIYWVKGLV